MLFTFMRIIDKRTPFSVMRFRITRGGELFSAFDKEAFEDAFPVLTNFDAESNPQQEGTGIACDLQELWTRFHSFRSATIVTEPGRG